MQVVRDFYKVIDLLAPFSSSYSWDNTGLLVGDMDQKVEKLLISLDVTDDIVDYAIEQRVDLIISHHPVIFQAQKRITQKKLLKLISHQIAVISAHTNLDITKYGINYLLAKAIGLNEIKPLSMSSDIGQYQISVFVPEGGVEKTRNEEGKIPQSFVDRVLKAMHEAGAGVIGDYQHCASKYEVQGQFIPSKGSSPFIGKQGNLEVLSEVKIEMLCEEMYLSAVLRAMINAHPYETPVYSVIPLKQKSSNFGLGSYGELPQDMTLQDLAKKVKLDLSAPIVKLWLADKKVDTLIKSVAVCGGSGNSIINEASIKADVFISSDFSYHQLLDAPMPIIDAGHFYTENLITIYMVGLFKDFDCNILVADAKIHDIKKLKLI